MPALGSPIKPASGETSTILLDDQRDRITIGTGSNYGEKPLPTHGDPAPSARMLSAVWPAILVLLIAYIDAHRSNLKCHRSGISTTNDGRRYCIRAIARNW